jgi:hypothetical protein
MQEIIGKSIHVAQMYDSTASQAILVSEIRTINKPVLHLILIQDTWNL